MPTQKTGEPRFCACCATLLERKRINGRLEDFGVFNRRKFCNQECMAKAMHKDDPKRQAYNMRARKQSLKPACELCAATEKLSIHHMDRNWRNNSPANLQTLCASCHTSLHHAAGDISPTREKPPCMYCGKPSYRSGVCSTCRTRIRRHGDPSIGRAEWLASLKRPPR